MIHTIQPPQFDLSSLEPYFDTATMDLHVNKHHQGYADKLNAALENTPELQSKSLEDLVSLPADHYSLITNMSGGVLNHNFFWSVLTTPSDSREAPPWFTPDLKTSFTQAATTLFGSGWTWLVFNPSADLPAGEAGHQPLTTINLPNQDSPLSQGLVPLLALDLWEHSYYLKYQNRRPEYIDAFWHLVNWQKVDSLYQSPITVR